MRGTDGIEDMNEWRSTSTFPYAFMACARRDHYINLWKAGK